MSDLKDLRFWPWMLSENKGKIFVPVLLLVISIVNVVKGELDAGFMFLYTLTIISIIVSIIGIRRHWKLLMKLKQLEDADN